MHIGGDIIGTGSPDIVGFGSITAATFFGDGSGLTNTGAQLSSATSGSERVVLTDKTSGTMTTAKTDPQLTFNFATNTLSSSAFVGNLTGDVTGDLTGNADTATLATNVVGSNNCVLFNSSANTTATNTNFTFNGTQLAVNNILAQNIRISSSGSNEIDTASGNLVLDAASNTVQVTTNLLISGTTASTNKTSGSLIVSGGVGIAGKLHVGDDIIAFAASDSNLKDNITVIPNALDKINALSGNTCLLYTSPSPRD